MGGAEKTADKWRKTWSDLKGSVKQKAREARKSAERSAGGGGHSKSLTPIEERIAALIGPLMIQGISEDYGESSFAVADVHSVSADLPHESTPGPSHAPDEPLISSQADVGSIHSMDETVLISQQSQYFSASGVDDDLEIRPDVTNSSNAKTERKPLKITNENAAAIVLAQQQTSAAFVDVAKAINSLAEASNRQTEFIEYVAAAQKQQVATQERQAVAQER